jgi:AraC family transcriptional regulator of adaptative response/methylated-DNA-[protein]-cysteine methyltransferase
MISVSSTGVDVAEEVRPDEAWAAVLARDPRFDGRFVYAVASTGVFCRPVCPSRRPRRRNVSFFATAEAAEAAGFRACRRCRPVAGDPSPAVRAVERARAFLDAHPEERVTLERLARVAHLSPAHLQRTFKRLLGVSPREYAAARRAERLREGLRGGKSVSRASFDAGYGSSSRVYEQGATRLGMTPAAYRRGGKGMRVRFSVVASPLGRLLVAGTERGVCAVTLGEDDAELEAALRREFPQAELRRADAGLQGWTERVVAHLANAAEPLDLPLDVRATAFQLRVWSALREIPPGSTASYREVAARIGAPAAARAVARACASNPVALVIPCHRVVREDGGLGGYRWGMERKRRLLEAERDAPPG